MPELTELQQKVLLLAELGKRVKAAEAAVKELLATVMEPGQTNRPQMDGRAVGSVAYTQPEAKVTVVRPDAFLAWVDKFHPTEVEVTVRVKPAFLSSLKVVGGNVVDADLQVPDGVAAMAGAPYLAVRPNKDAGALLWPAIRNTVLAEIEAGDL